MDLLACIEHLFLSYSSEQVLFRSFLPHGAGIKHVTVYPSEFGLQQMVVKVRCAAGVVAVLTLVAFQELEREKGPQGVFKSGGTAETKAVVEESEQEEFEEEDIQREMDEVGGTSSDNDSDVDIVAELRDGGEDDAESKISPELNEKLRDYELRRLRYYFAVIFCESTEIAKSSFSTFATAPNVYASFYCFLQNVVS